MTNGRRLSFLVNIEQAWYCNVKQEQNILEGGNFCILDHSKDCTCVVFTAVTVYAWSETEAIIYITNHSRKLHIIVLTCKS